MFTIVLTIIFCLTNGVQYENFEENNTTTRNFDNDIIYNIYDYLKGLYLQRCAFVAIGLKNFAIFVEQASNTGSGNIHSKKYFLGMCHQDTLEDWAFCSQSLESKVPHKCRFRLRDGKYHGRVHRRFCDMRVMQNNKDCQCLPTIYDEQMFKVEGFPTCYIPPLPDTLCKYNVCGLARCKTATVESRVHTVECDPNCRGANPFCEYPLDKSAKLPLVESGWSKWTRDNKYMGGAGEERSISTCINKKTGRGDVDCLGPGTGCCSKSPKNCSCNLYEDNGQLVMERILNGGKVVRAGTNIPIPDEVYSTNNPFPEDQIRDPKEYYRYVREADEFMSDDDGYVKDGTEMEDIVGEEVTQDALCRTLDQVIEKGEIQHAKDDECPDIKTTEAINRAWSFNKNSEASYVNYVLKFTVNISLLLMIK